MEGRLSSLKDSFWDPMGKPQNPSEGFLNWIDFGQNMILAKEWK
jgi:hypothetical protein